MRNLLVLVASSAMCASALAEDVYRVAFDDRLEQVTVDACFDGAPPDRLYHHRQASRYLESFHAGDRRLRLAPGSGSTRLRNLGSEPCLRWRVDLQAAASQGEARLAMRPADALVIDTTLWLWRGAGRRPARIDIAVPDDIDISTPWAEAPAPPGIRRFRPAPTPATWSSRFAIGHFHAQAIPVAGTDLRLAILGSPTADQRDKLVHWISAAADALGAVYSQFPAPATQVLVIPIGPSRGAVPWAHVMRGGGPGAELFVDENRPMSEFMHDWTAPHELSHLLLPFVSSRDRWLSEGLASWYQYLLLARSGALSPEQAWQKLHEGFRRGRNDADRKSLAEATREGWSHTMRVYWSGAAMMMLADTRLRALSDGEQSLDTALAGLQSCCLPSHRRWRAIEVFRELDRVTGTRVFTDLYKAHVNASRFPNLERTWQRLGIDASGRQLRFVNGGEWLGIRRSIMAATPAPRTLPTP